MKAKPKKAMKKAVKKVMKNITVKGVSMAGLTPRQQQTMKKHGVHHTKKHMTMMKNMMKKGKSFTQAHKETQKKVGK